MSIESCSYLLREDVFFSMLFHYLQMQYLNDVRKGNGGGKVRFFFFFFFFSNDFNNTCYIREITLVTFNMSNG